MAKQQRIALVIGNAGYWSAAPLKNAVNDAALITARLMSLGFEIVGGASSATSQTGYAAGQDLTSLQMVALTGEFLSRVQSGALAVVYYTGHGLQVGGRSYLVPVDDTLAPDLPNFGLYEIKPRLETLASRVGSDGRVIVFLDAARNDPISAKQRAQLLDLLDQHEVAEHGQETRGQPVGIHGGMGSLKLMRSDHSGGVFIALSAAPGDIAYDGSTGSPSSPFAVALDRNLAIRGLELNALFDRVKIDVRDAVAAIGKFQQPWSESNINSPLRLNSQIALPTLGLRMGAAKLAAVARSYLDLGVARALQGLRSAGLATLFIGPCVTALGVHVWLHKASIPVTDVTLGSPRVMAMPHLTARPARAHDGGITRLALSPSGKWAATGGPDGRVRIWETAIGRLHEALRTPKPGTVTALAVSDGTQVGNVVPGVVTVSWLENGIGEGATSRGTRMLLGTARLDEASFKPVTLAPQQLPGDFQVAEQINRANHLAAAHPSGPTAVAHNWRVLSSSGKSGEFELIADSANRPTALAPLSGADARFVVGYANGIVGVIGPNTDKADHKAGAETPVREIASDGRGAMVASVAQDGDVTLWEVAGDGRFRLEPLRSLALPLQVREASMLQGITGGLRSVQMSPDGRRVLTVPEEGAARIWDAESGRDLTQLRGHVAAVLEAGFSPDGRSIVTASEDGSVRVWDSETGRQLGVLTGHEQPVGAARYSPNGRFIVSLSGRTARLWDAVLLAPLAVIEATDGRTLSNVLAFSADGSLLATATSDGVARLWRTAGWTQIAELRGHTDSVTSAAFSPDGAWLLTSSNDRTARVWNTLTGAQAVTLSGHTGNVRSVAFSPDGRQIATTSADRSARLWESATGNLLATLSGHAGGVWSGVFSPDGKWLLTAAADPTAILWDTATGQQIASVKGVARWLRGRATAFVIVRATAVAGVFRPAAKSRIDISSPRNVAWTWPRLAPGISTISPISDRMAVAASRLA